MVDQQMDVLVLPASFTAQTGQAHWQPLLRARAIENLCYTVAAAQGGYHVNGRQTWGHSMIIDPWGYIMSEISSGTGCAVADLDLDRLKNIRTGFPSLQHRRIQCD